MIRLHIFKLGPTQRVIINKQEKYLWTFQSSLPSSRDHFNKLLCLWRHNNVDLINSRLTKHKIALDKHGLWRHDHPLLPSRKRSGSGGASASIHPSGGGPVSHWGSVLSTILPSISKTTYTKCKTVTVQKAGLEHSDACPSASVPSFMLSFHAPTQRAFNKLLILDKK